MRIVWEESQIEKAWDSARQKGCYSLVTMACISRKYIENPAIEIQIVGDQYGKVAI